MDGNRGVICWSVDLCFRLSEVISNLLLVAHDANHDARFCIFLVAFLGFFLWLVVSVLLVVLGHWGHFRILVLFVDGPPTNEGIIRQHERRRHPGHPRESTAAV